MELGGSSSNDWMDKRETFRHTHTQKHTCKCTPRSFDDENRDWSEYVYKPGNIKNHQQPPEKKHGMDSPTKSSEGTNPVDTDFGPLASRTMKEQIPVI